MGIPSYFKKIIDEFPNTIKTSLDFNVDNVFLDFNCCIHGCSSTLKSYNFNSNNEFEQELIKRQIHLIYFIFQLMESHLDLKWYNKGIDDLCHHGLKIN